MDAFTTAAIETALWSETDDAGNPLDDEYSADDLAPETLAEIVRDCEAFQEAHGEVIDEHGTRAQAGHDFWLTRNRHGAGFWDGDWPSEIGRVLTDAAHVYGTCGLYVGDDGKIYSHG